MTRIVLAILMGIVVMVNLMLGAFIYSVLEYLQGKTPLVKGLNYEQIAKYIKGKNYLQKNNKLYVINNYIITPTTPISGVVEVNGERKNFKNLTLKQLQNISNIGKVYITQIGDIKLKGAIVVSNIGSKNIIYGDIEERDQATKTKTSK